LKIKVLIVDDEKLERVLIHKGFKWEENGFEIIGEAANGVAALEFFEQGETPDIVLTDINMPVMDGLTLAEKILKNHSNCHVVIITGYREFDYAQRAVKIGVRDFILKPVSFEDIEQTVLNIKSEIEEEKLFSEEFFDLKTREAESKCIVLSNDFNKIFADKLSAAEVEKILNKHDVSELLNGCFCSVLRYQNIVNDPFTTKTNINLIEHITSKGALLGFSSDNGDVIFYFDQSKYNEAEKLLEQGCIFANDTTGYSLGYSISDVFGGNSAVKDAYFQAISRLKVEKNKKYNRITQNAMDYIEENLSNASLNLKMVAQAIFVNESYLSRVFRQDTGERLIEYISRRRIELSKKLLKTTDLKSYEVAEAVGINNPHYFSICFKKYVGKTVTEYKND